MPTNSDQGPPLYHRDHRAADGRTIDADAAFVLYSLATMSAAAQDIAAIIRAKLASGELPSAKPEKVWAGKGTGQSCSGCGRPITADQVEYEMDLPGARVAMRLHQSCLEVWDNQRNNFPPKDFPPKADVA
jgi:hypothetical protein